MTCPEVRALFSDIADARLAPGERAAWDAHLTTCAECRREWASFQRTLGLLRGLPRHRAPVGFVDRVMAAAHPVPWPRRLARRLSLPLGVKLPLAAAALALVAVGAMYLVQRTPETQQAMRDTPAPANAPPGPASPQSETVAPQPVQPASQPEPAAHQLAAPEAKSRVDSMNVPLETASERTEPAPAPAAPAPEARAPSRDVAAGRLMRQERVRTATAVAPGVTGLLAVADRDAAERALALLAARVGATEVGRMPAENGLLVELDVPRAQYTEFTRGLADIGGWTVREERLSPGVDVRVRVIVVRSPAR